MRRVIACSAPHRWYRGIKAGDKVGSQTGYEYLAPSPTTDKVVGPNTKSRTTVFTRNGWELRLITSTYNNLGREENGGSRLIELAVRRATLA